MIFNDGPPGQPPDSSKSIDNDVVKRKDVKKKTTTFDIPNKIPPSTENVTTFEGKKNEEKIPEIEKNHTKRSCINSRSKQHNDTTNNRNSDGDSHYQRYNHDSSHTPTTTF